MGGMTFFRESLSTLGTKVAMETSHQVDWLILTALPLEFKAVSSHLSNHRNVVHGKGTQYEVGEFPIGQHQLSIAIVECGAGNVAAAIEAERAISFFQPKNALFVGVAGAIKDAKLGDVVCATKIYQYESGKAADIFLTRPQVFQSAYPLVQASKAIAREARWKDRVILPDADRRLWGGAQRAALLGPMAAGEKVVASIRSPEYEFIRNSYNDAVAVEMEGYGFLHAGYANTTNCMVIRGISDVVEGKADADSSGSQPRSAAAAAGFAFELIALLGGESALHVSDSQWQRLERLAVSLYPLGPTQNEVWSRAGGDQATLQLGTVGMASWHYAFRLLRNGGGGRDITFDSLLSTFLG